MKKFLKQLKENKKGFTLIEMIVVIAIIGILAAILVPSMSGYLSTARDSKKEANARTIYTAAQAAVTSLETSTPVVNGTYTKNSSGATHTPTEGVTQNNTLAGTFFSKIKSLIGESNYDNFNQITVTVEDGAVTSVSVIEQEGDQAVTYPTPTPTPTST